MFVANGPELAAVVGDGACATPGLKIPGMLKLGKAGNAMNYLIEETSLLGSKIVRFTFHCFFAKSMIRSVERHLLRVQDPMAA